VELEGSGLRQLNRPGAVNSYGKQIALAFEDDRLSSFTPLTASSTPLARSECDY
jgi:hypothetical protein